MRRTSVSWLAILAGLVAFTVIGQARQGGFGNAPAPPVPPPQDATGVVSGVVTDANTRQPIAGAVVSVQTSARGAGPARSQLTDARGRFIVSGIGTPGNYSINASKLGFFSTLPQPRQFSLGTGQWLADVRIELTREGSISGVVLDERNEPIVGARVRVLAEVIVAGRSHLASSVVVRTDDRGAYRIAGLAAGRYFVSIPSVQNAVPADTSAAVIAGVNVPTTPGGVTAERTVAERPTIDVGLGQKLVVGAYVTPPPADAAGRAQAYPITFFPNALTIAEATPIGLRPGEQRTGVDLQLRPVRTFAVAGRLEGVSDAVAGLPLRLIPAGCEGLGDGSEAATTLVMSDGRFVFPRVPAGRYTLDARSSLMEYIYRPQSVVSSSDALPRTPGFVSSGGGGGSISGSAAGTSYNYAIGNRDASFWGRAEVDVAGRDLTDVVVRMQRTMRLSGRVVTERSSGIEDPTPAPSAPLPAAAGRAGAPGSAIRGFVTMEPADGSPALGMVRGTVGADNTFSVDGLMPGRYVITVLTIGLNPGGTPTSLKSIVSKNTDYTYTPIDTTSGGDITDVVVTFIDKTQKVTGTVSNLPPGGSGAVVLAFPADRTKWTDFGFSPSLLRSVAVNGNGTYELQVPAGDFCLIAVSPTRSVGWQNPAFFEAASRTASRVALDWGETKRQDLRFTEVTP